MKNVIAEFLVSDDIYNVIVVSSGHLTHQDDEGLNVLARRTADAVVLDKSPGYVVKLDPDNDSSLEELYPHMSESFYSIIKSATEAGFGMVEFDPDGKEYASLTLFDW